MKNLTKVLIWYFPKTEVPFVMRIETKVLKNKVVKTQGPNPYLTLNKKKKFCLGFLFLSITTLPKVLMNYASLGLYAKRKKKKTLREKKKKERKKEKEL
jgi:hypothetical protein